MPLQEKFEIEFEGHDRGGKISAGQTVLSGTY